MKFQIHCFKCQKFAHHKNMCTGRTVCSSYRKRSGLHHQWLSWTAVVQIVVKIAQSKLDHVKCGQRKKKKDNEHKIYKENPFSRSTKNPGGGAWKIKTTHRSPKIIHRMPKSKIQNKILITKLLQLGPKDWPKFINGIIPILSTNVIHTRFLSKGGAKPGEDRKYK